MCLVARLIDTDEVNTLSDSILNDIHDENKLRLKELTEIDKIVSILNVRKIKFGEETIHLDALKNAYKERIIEFVKCLDPSVLSLPDVLVQILLMRENLKFLGYEEREMKDILNYIEDEVPRIKLL